VPIILVCLPGSHLLTPFLFYLSILHRFPSDLFERKFAEPPCSKFITQLEELNTYDNSSLPFRLYVKNLVTFHFVAVKIMYGIVLESTSIFKCPTCFYVYHSCMHKCNPNTDLYSFSFSAKWPHQNCSTGFQVFIMCKWTFETVQFVESFQWYSCYRMAWNHRTLTSQNGHIQILN
jgi:hypothetical protein